MNRYSLITLTAASLLAASAFAGGATDKVTGEFGQSAESAGILAR